MMHQNSTVRKLLLNKIETAQLRIKRKTADNKKIKCNYLKLGFDRILKLCYYYNTFVHTQTVLQETPILNNCINPDFVICHFENRTPMKLERWLIISYFYFDN